MDPTIILGGSIHPPETLRGICVGPALILAAFLILVPPAAAHAPTDMVLKYDSGAGILSVTITHPVADVQTHYIRDVIISVNGKNVNTTMYTSQPDPSAFTYTYPVTTLPGDTLEVTAECVLGGSLSKSITLPETDAGSSDAATGQGTTRASPVPAYLPALAIILIPLLGKTG
ncbi:MAG: hypothetical protein ABFC24_03580 [Methanoregulaceae archaeon]